MLKLHFLLQKIKIRYAYKYCLLEKCRSNGVRALGNIFHILPKEWVQLEVDGLVKEIIEVLIKNINSGPVKV